jgi:serine protease Do
MLSQRNRDSLMIRRTLAATQAATFAVQLPEPQLQGMPRPVGTGFFVSPDGFFVTAAHVISVPDRVQREDVSSGWLMKESRGANILGMCEWPEVVYVDQAQDFALLKLDWDKNSNKQWLQGRRGFPHLNISSRPLDEGEPVYSFGYPLSTSEITFASPEMTMGHSALAPRVTSAIVASTLERSEMVGYGDRIDHYVLDTALNYGNSGGPIVAVDTGHVHAICTHFQPVFVRQSHLVKPGQQTVPVVMIPSLYGVAKSLGESSILAKLREYGVPIHAT